MARDEEGGAPLPAVYGCLGNQIQDDTGRRGSVCVCTQINTKNETLTSQSRRNRTPEVWTPAFTTGREMKLLSQTNKHEKEKGKAEDRLRP